MTESISPNKSLPKKDNTNLTSVHIPYGSANACVELKLQTKLR
jgi:hypothetical protein